MQLMVNGIINVLKPSGMTSHDVVALVRRTANIKRVGHAGTLDPAAAGVLPVFIGNATRFIEYFPDDKEYFAEVIFGCETDTCDDTGNIVRSCTKPHIEKESLQTVLRSFVGSIQQVPPIYSAIKVNGRKLYDYARCGEEITIKPREVAIYSAELLDMAESSARIIVNCSSGTYIRSLCRDVGYELNVPAMMGFLLRSRVGVFSLKNAVTLEQLTEKITDFIIPADQLLKLFLPGVTLPARESAMFEDGWRIPVVENDANTCTVHDWRGNFIGVAAIKEQMLIADKVVRSASRQTE